jgi:MFS family permease
MTVDVAPASPAGRTAPIFWVLLAAAGCFALTMGARQSMGLYLGTINTHTGLGLASISLAFAFGQLWWGLTQPFAGMLADRVGAGRAIVAGVLMVAVGTALGRSRDAGHRHLCALLFQRGLPPVARFSSPRGTALNAANTVLYVADQSNNRIRVVSLTSSAHPVATYAGSGMGGNADGSALSAAFSPRPVDPTPVGSLRAPRVRVASAPSGDGDRRATSTPSRAPGKVEPPPGPGLPNLISGAQQALSSGLKATGELFSFQRLD